MKFNLKSKADDFWFKSNEKVLRNTAPYSKDLENNQIDAESLNIALDEALNRSISNLDIFVANFEIFFEITWSVRDSLRKNFSSIFWESFRKEDFDEIFSEFENNKDISKKFKELTLSTNPERKKVIIQDILQKLTDSDIFKNYIKNCLKNKEEFSEKIDDIKSVMSELINNKDLELDVSWTFEWRKGKWIMNKLKQISTVKKIAYLWVFITTVLRDIDAWSRFAAPKSDLSSWFWDILPTLISNINNWFVTYWDVIIWWSFWVVDVTFKVLLIETVLRIISNKKIDIKEYWKLWVYWTWVVWATAIAAFLMWVSSAGNDLKWKLITENLDNWIHWNTKNNVRVVESSISGNYNELVSEDWILDLWKLNNKKTKNDLFETLSWVIEFWKVFTEVFWIAHSWWELVNDFDSEKVLTLLIDKIDKWELDEVWVFKVLDKYKEEIIKNALLKNVYKSIFKNILNESRWNSSTWIKWFWKVAYEKMYILISTSWFDKEWSDFNTQLESFIFHIYENKEEANSVLKEIKEWITYVNFNPVAISSNLSLNLKDLQNEFIKKNFEKINIFKNKIKDLVKEVKLKGASNIKFSDFNKVIIKFGTFVKIELPKNIEKYWSDVDKVTNAIELVYKKIDEENKKVSKYKIANVDKKENVYIWDIEQIPEQSITIQEVLTWLEDWISIYKETWKITDSIKSFVNNFEISLALNYWDLALIFWLILFSIKRWLRMKENWEMASFNDVIKLRDKEFTDKSSKIYSIISDIVKIVEENKDEFEKRGVDQKIWEKMSGFLKNFWITKDRNQDLFFAYNKKEWVIDSEFDFAWWKLYQSSLLDLSINPNKFKNLNNNDTVFIPEVDISFSWNNLWIVENENWTYSISVWLDLQWKVLDFNSDYFNQIIQEWWTEEYDNISISVDRNRVWVLISKEWFIVLPYSRKIRSTDYEYRIWDNLQKYIK